MMSHTPGPWNVDELTVYALNNTDTNRFSAWVQRGWLNDEAGRTPQAELAANARLIAAAPDLLNVCIGILECLDEKDRWTSVSRRFAANSLRAAIAKARGE